MVDIELEGGGGERGRFWGVGRGWRRGEEKAKERVMDFSATIFFTA